jgi:Cu+-exporting ATPase
MEKDPEQYLDCKADSPIIPEIGERKRLPKDSIGLDRLCLPIKGINCASCVAKIEKVNLATKKAAIAFDPGQVHMSDFINTIEDLGYEIGLEKVTLPVQGMSCASCVGKVQSALSHVPGVTRAHVNFAAEKATVEYISGQVTVKDLSEAVEAIGYKLLDAEERDIVDTEKQAKEAELRELKQKFMTGVMLVVPLFILVHWDKLGLSQVWALTKQANFFVQLIFQTPV